MILLINLIILNNWLCVDCGFQMDLKTKATNSSFTVCSTRSFRIGNSDIAQNSSFYVQIIRLSRLDINEILISEVAKRPLLYGSQTQLEGHGAKTKMRRQLWSDVYESLNHIVPLARLPTIWKNIRDRYHKVRRIANVDGLKPKYRYYDQLRFLDRDDDDVVGQKREAAK